jgi:hypothetical protein
MTQGGRAHIELVALVDSRAKMLRNRVAQIIAMLVCACCVTGIVACSHVQATIEMQGPPFLVNTRLDAIDANPGDGFCRDSGGRCSLRAAVMEANAWPGADIIEVPSGNYVLTIVGREEDSAATGDIDNTGPLTINGAGEASTVIDGGAIDRALHNLEGAILELNEMTVRNGHVTLADELFESAGGGVRGEGMVTLRNVTLSGNRSDGPGGGVAAVGDVHLTNVTVSRNLAVSVGGGIVQLEGKLTLEDVGIDDNRSDLIGGGLWQNDTGWASMTRVVVRNNEAIGAGGLDIGGIATMTDCVVRNNAATGSGPAVSGLGGGIITRGRPLRLINTTIEENEAVRDGGGIFIGWVPIEDVTVMGTFVMEGGSISQNRAGESGGGIVNFGATATLRNVSIVGNRADTGLGGGISNSSPRIEDTVYAGQITVIGGSVSQNYAGAGNGGASNSDPGIMTMSDVTIVDNVDGGG